jgi:hypothetical protein
LAEFGGRCRRAAASSQPTGGDHHWEIAGASLTPHELAGGRINDTNDALGLRCLSSDRDYQVRTKGYFCSIIQTPFHSSAGGFA